MSKIHFDSNIHNDYIDSYIKDIDAKTQAEKQIKESHNETISEKKMKTSIYVFPSLLRKLKIHCAQEGLTISDFLTYVITEALAKEKRGRNKTE